MSQSGTKGAFGWVAQYVQDDVPLAAEYNPQGMTWHKVLAGDVGLMDDQRPYDPEVGGSFLSPGTYKSSYWTAGRLSMRPRLQPVQGSLVSANPQGIVTLLWGFAGSSYYTATPTTVTVTTATLPALVMGAYTKVSEITGIDAKTMIFPGANGTVQFGADLASNQNKFLTFRKLTPVATGYIGETFPNCKVAGITLGSASTGPLGMDVAIQGGAGASDTVDQYVLEAITGEPTYAQGWDYPASLGVDSVPHAAEGFVKLGAADSVELRYVRDLQITLGSGMTRPQDMTMIGQQTPGDYAVLGRDIGVSFTFLWDNPDLYRKIKLGGVSGTKWSSSPYVSPFFCSFKSPQATPYAIGFFAQAMDVLSSPIGLKGQTQVLMQVTGVVRDPGNSTAGWGMWMAGPALDKCITWPAS